MRNLIAPFCLIWMTGCGIDSPSPISGPVHNYEIKVEFSGPQGPIRSSGILRTTGVSGKAFLEGEAIPIDFPNGKTAYVLVSVPFKSWEFSAPWVRKVDLESVSSGQYTPLDPRLNPWMVVFRKKDDPTSIERIDEKDTIPTLGEGYTFKGFWIRETSQSPSESILNRMPWLSGWKDNASGKPGMDSNYKSWIGRPSFKRYM